MPKRIPIKAAKDLSKQYDLKQVILCVWDGKLTHIVTYGKTIEDCDQAAQGGNKIKKALGWPEELCKTEPSRVKKLKKEIEKLMELTNYTIGCDPGSPSGSHSVRYLAMDENRICKMAEEVRESWHKRNYKSGAFCGEDHSDNYYSGGDDAIDLFKDLMLARLKEMK